MRRNSSDRRKQVTVHLDEEVHRSLQQFMLTYGVDSASQAVHTVLRAYFAANVENALIAELCYGAVREMRKQEFELLANHFQSRADTFRTAAVSMRGNDT